MRSNDSKMYATVALAVARQIPDQQLLTELRFTFVGETKTRCVDMVYDDYRYLILAEVGCEPSTISVYSYNGFKETLSTNFETELMQQLLRGKRNTLKLTCGDLMREIVRMVDGFDEMEHELIIENAGRPVIKEPDVLKSECVAIFIDNYLSVDDRVGFMEQVSKEQSEILSQLYTRMN